MLPFDPKKPSLALKVRAPHAQRRIHLFEDDEKVCVLFRPKNAPRDWVGGLLSGINYYMGVKHSLKLRRTRVEIDFRREIEDRLFFRVFHLADPRENEQRIWRILWHPDFAYTIPLRHPKQSERTCGAFFWPQKPHFKVSLWHTPTFALQQHFEHEWHDAASDVRAALPWCDLSEMDRAWHSIKWICGGKQELEGILRAAYIIECRCREDEVLQIFWYFESPETKPTSSRFFKTKQRVVRWEPNPEHRISRITERLSERNQGVVDQLNGLRLTWNRNWVKDVPISTNYHRTHTMIQIEPPNQHERMEALLVLRNWLSENAPDLLSDWF